MLKKVPFPYASMTSPDYFKQPALLPIEAYDDDLADVPCSQKRYTQVKNIVEYFGMTTQEEYHDLYLRTDVLALADCMLAHRKEWRSLYDLDALQAMTLPSAALQAMLKVSKARVELITDSNGGIISLSLRSHYDTRSGTSHHGCAAWRHETGHGPFARGPLSWAE